jgi:hypothetical protein
MQAYRANIRVETVPTTRGCMCHLCGVKMGKGESRIKFLLSHYHTDCFIELLVGIPEIRERLQQALEKVIIERMENG